MENICEVFTDGDWIESKDQSESGIRLIQTGNIGTTNYLDKENNKKWISEGYISKMVNSRNRINEKIIFLHINNTEEICNLMHSFLD